MADGDTEARPSLKFAPDPARTLLRADETDRLAATVRYEDEKDIIEGDTLRLLDAEGGGRLGTATVEHAEAVPVREALDVIQMHWAEYGIRGRHELLDQLNEYYDATLAMETGVSVFILDPTLDDGGDAVVTTA